jgi:NAD(P)-dependent dehydrogenase (short-subunit alcohol dehydrogenase family)
MTGRDPTRPAPAQERSAVHRTALVTGANRGLGLEVCRQLGRRGLRVVLTGRDGPAVRAAAAALRGEGLDVLDVVLDVRREGAADSLAERLRQAGLRVDVLVNNAAVNPAGTLLEAPAEAFREAIGTNFAGALWTCRAFVPAMVAAGYGRVVNVSSDYGSFGAGLEGPAAYSLSKAALNALTVKLASEVTDDVKVNAAHPGWVRTRMGGPAAQRSPAARSPEDAARGIVWLATLSPRGPNGGFFRDHRRIPW